MENGGDITKSNSDFFVNDWLDSKNISIVQNAVYCFDMIWEGKENYDNIVNEKRHSELLFDVISHDIGNYHQTILTSLDLVTSLFRANNNTISLPQNEKKILSCLTIAKNALTRGQSLVDNIRRLERFHMQKDPKLISKNLPDVINNAYSVMEQILYNNNPNSKNIKMAMKLEDGLQPGEINIIAEDLLGGVFINLFSNCVKYTNSSEVKIDVLIKDYFIGEAKYWMTSHIQYMLNMYWIFHSISIYQHFWNY
jgi:signal transduction histidine kinase